MPCGKANQIQCDQTSTFSHQLNVPWRPSARWRRSVGVLPRPIHVSKSTGYSTLTRRSSASGSSLGILYVAR